MHYDIDMVYLRLANSPRINEGEIGFILQDLHKRISALEEGKKTNEQLAKPELDKSGPTRVSKRKVPSS